MKKLILPFIACFTALLFISAGKQTNELTKISLVGVWELQHQFIYENDEIQDTLFNLDGYRQVKMYSKGKVMWTRFNPADENEWFGYGTYTIKDGFLEERLEYASNSMMKIVDTVQVFRFRIETDKKTYSQVSFEDDGSRNVSEHYKRVE